jgi:sterol desaturase/sphingolipid hydroxylase (fatty acid hydroxylase superfamily)
MKPRYKSIQIFETPFLEYFTHVPVAVPALVWGPVVGYLLWSAVVVHQLGAGVISGLFVAGMVLWTLAEYVLHRFVFHFNPHGHLQERFQFVMHGMHHDDANDPTRLVMSPVVGLVLAVLFYGLFFKALGPLLVEPFFAGFVLGYLGYDYTHFYIHHAKPQSRIGKALKQHHMVHHYAKVPVRWGVSSPLWDHVFGTYQEK